ncbi:uncharacterized protein LAESUDRAFT_730313 [Laetiporus sulphureus 93-53]|uniref:Uncharacterized protein n=1 Tax=Laetiporus sulphureus 93-53 TaxID=1314785 RepID=A0A165C7I5_9APHY|nr:uncharacterized protein LAESUDRAFT_730313 [Laetiporus sulphureus 93-53]KZT02337.1 hypothetical protein LAESUDRAFT_730313 [Laetiporus sulphureus 93-53]
MAVERPGDTGELLVLALNVLLSNRCLRLVSLGCFLLGARPFGFLVRPNPLRLSALSILLSAPGELLGLVLVLVCLAHHFLSSPDRFFRKPSRLLSALPILFGALSILLGALPILLGALPILLSPPSILLGPPSILLSPPPISLSPPSVSLSTTSVPISPPSILLSAPAELLRLALILVCPAHRFFSSPGRLLRHPSGFLGKHPVSFPPLGLFLCCGTLFFG